LRSAGNKIITDYQLVISGDFMQLILTIPDDLARQIQLLPDYDNFIREALQAAIQQRKIKPLSKWAKIAQRMDQFFFNHRDYTEKFKQDMREVRENFVFKDSPRRADKARLFAPSSAA